MKIADLHIDNNWTLFLDRDGVINRKIDNDYVRNWEQFEFLPDVKESLKELSQIFNRIIIVTNQRGVGRGLMSEQELENIHRNVMQEVEEAGGRIDAIFSCTDIEDAGSTHRKPKPGMALDAKTEFPEIDFSRSIIAGDALSDMEFGENLGMITVLIYPKLKGNPKFHFDTLFEFSSAITQKP